MTPEMYQEKRDELAAVLGDCTAALGKLAAKEEVLKEKGIEGHIRVIDGIRRKVYEDQFRIALLSKFQGGKSTTFNALANGHPISPMGDGAIRTSACVCRVWNVADPADVGANIIWRTDDELLLSVLDLLSIRFLQLDNERFLGKTLREIADDFSLTREADRELFHKAVEADISEYLKDQRAYTSSNCTVAGGTVLIHGTDKTNILTIAAIIDKFYGNAVIEELKSAVLTIDQAGALLRFPAKFTVKQMDFLKGADVFDPEEVAFAFIKEVQFRVQSANLSRIGAAITDCPGLSASSYDTRIAMDIIGESDAVWYLLDGRAIGQFETEDIRKAHTAAAGRIFFTVNLKSDVNSTRIHVVNNVIPHQKATLEQAGITADLNPYHALLTLLAMTGPELLPEKGSPETRDTLIRKAEEMGFTADSAEEAWTQIAEDMLYLLKPPSRQEFRKLPSGLCERGVEIVREASELDVILDQVEGYVIGNKARAVLLGGVDVAVNAIEDGIEKPLLARERAAKEREEDLRKAYDKQRAALDKFHKHSQFILGNLRNTGIDRRLAEDFLDHVVLPAVPAAASKAAPQVNRRLGLNTIAWDKLRELLTRSKSKLKAEIEAILKDALQQATAPKLEEWREQIKSGSNTVFREFLGTVLECRNRIAKDWEVLTGEMPDLQVLPSPNFFVPEVGGGIALAPENVQSELETMAAADDAKVFVARLLSGWAIFGTIAFFVPGIGPIFAIIGMIVLALFLQMVSNDEKLIQRIYEVLQKSLEVQFEEEREKIVTALATEGMSKLREPYLALFEEGFVKQSKALAEQRAQAEADLKEGREVRERVARECHVIRTQHVVALRRRLQSYREGLLPLV